jgi:uncharacterized repeat protein (TIGR02543 family)
MKNKNRFLICLITILALITVIAGCKNPFFPEEQTKNSQLMTKTVTVSFDAHGGTLAPRPVSVAKGSKINVPAAMKNFSHTFGGWYQEASLSTPWNFNDDTVSGDITLHAKWTLFPVNLEELEERLNTLNGTSETNPATLKLEGAFCTSVIAPDNMSTWNDIYARIQSAEDYIVLDLSDCIAGDNVLDSGFNGIDSCPYIKGIILPSSLELLDASFSYNSILTSISIGDNVTSITNETFRGCSNLESVILGKNISSIGNYAFIDCINLQSIHIPNGVTSIGEMAFSTCSKIENLIIPESVTSIGSDAFYACFGLKTVEFKKGYISIENAGFPGNLRDVYRAGGAGIYTRNAETDTWTKN